MSFLNIDFREQVKMLLPPVMRSVSIIDYLSALTEPLTTLAAATRPFYDEQLIIAQSTSQKMVMQEVINDIMGITASPYVYIVTSRGEGLTSYVFPEGAGTTLHVWEEGGISTTYVLTEGEADLPSGYNFTVYVPASLSVDEQNRIDALVKQLKAPGLTYQTILY
jgi:hypothetical protein